MANHPDTTDAVEAFTTDDSQLDRIERKLDAVLAAIDEIRPLMAAAGEMTDKLAQGGPAGLISLLMGR